MWHEARRREKATQKLLNEHKKRAEKRREENKIDPNSLLQIHGLKAKLCLDPSVYKQAVKSLVAWQGDKSITIDRFDVRATLSSIPNESTTPTGHQSQDPNKFIPNDNVKRDSNERRNITVLDAGESEPLKKFLSYERYRLLIQNDLNRVPEELRLKLVSQSDVSADAKLRKLRYNKFGTSGDASIASGSNYMTSSSSTSRAINEISRRPGAAIGFNYNSAPQETSLIADLSNNNKLNHNNETPVNKALAIMDLDEFESFDLDGVHNSSEHFDTKRINEIARRYGLTSEEFLILAKRDGPDNGPTDVLKELGKLSKKNSVFKEESTNHTIKRVYGPDLPPELMAHNPIQSPLSSSSSSSQGGSPVQQRSPSGGQIPLRNGHKEDDADDRESPNSPTNGNTTNIQASTIVNKSVPPTSGQDSPLSIKTISVSPIASSALVKPVGRNQSEIELTSHSSSNAAVPPDNKDVPESMDGTVHQSARRASTPLAYKRNRRSSRSLSRERRSKTKSSRRSRRSRSKSSSSSFSGESSASDYSTRSSRRQTRWRHSSRHRKSTRRR